MASSAYESADDPVMWLKDAACRGSDLNLFFVNAGMSLSDEAAAMCASCPVRRECVTHAYSLGLSAGYFGGLSPSQRRALSLEEALDKVENG